MKILQINKYVTLNGGSEVVMKSIHQLLTERGHTVVNTGFRKSGQPMLPDAYELGPERLTASGMFYNPPLIRKLDALIRDFRPQAVICHNIYHHFPLVPLTRLITASCPKRILYLHDYKVVCPVYTLLSHEEICERCRGLSFLPCTLRRCKDRSLLKSALLSVESWFHHRLHVYRSFDRIISPSRFLAEKVRALGFPHEVVHLYNPLPDEDPLPVVSDPARNRRILYIGRLSREKGIDLLLSAAAALPDIEFVIGGGGSLKEKVSAAAARLPNLRYVGYLGQDEIRRWSAHADFLILPSIWYENNPLALLEAMKRGLPVIGARIGGIPELLDHGRGFLFDPLDRESLIRTIRRALDSTAEERKTMAEKAAAFAARLNFEHYYRSLMEILEGSSFFPTADT